MINQKIALFTVSALIGLQLGWMAQAQDNRPARSVDRLRFFIDGDRNKEVDLNGLRYDAEKNVYTLEFDPWGGGNAIDLEIPNDGAPLSADRIAQAIRDSATFKSEQRKGSDTFKRYSEAVNALDSAITPNPHQSVRALREAVTQYEAQAFAGAALDVANKDLKEIKNVNKQQKEAIEEQIKGLNRSLDQQKRLLAIAKRQGKTDLVGTYEARVNALEGEISQKKEALSNDALEKSTQDEADLARRGEADAAAEVAKRKRENQAVETDVKATLSKSELKKVQCCPSGERAIQGLCAEGDGKTKVSDFDRINFTLDGVEQPLSFKLSDVCGTDKNNENNKVCVVNNAVCAYVGDGFVVPFEGNAIFTAKPENKCADNLTAGVRDYQEIYMERGSERREGVSKSLKNRGFQTRDVNTGDNNKNTGGAESAAPSP